MMICVFAFFVFTLLFSDASMRGGFGSQSCSWSSLCSSVSFFGLQSAPLFLFVGYVSAFGTVGICLSFWSVAFLYDEVYEVSVTNGCIARASVPPSFFWCVLAIEGVTVLGR